MTNIPGYGIGTPPLREIFDEKRLAVLSSFASKKTHAYSVLYRQALSMALNGWHDKLSGVMNRYVLLSVLGRDFKPPFYGRP